ncbi:MAG TPA: DUF3095 domain-containing protein [Geminicoccaceae bacterium]|nr:DUF3095 domain-containing protein [Geminicoccaceae bacterium]
MAPPTAAPQPCSSPTFYGELEPFADFAEVADPARYVAAPLDWVVILTDIKGSTEAAKGGRYKDVNLIGAACITAVLNVTKGLELPYAFGGDGATVLIPPEVRDVVADALLRTRRLAASGFGLELRVGMVPVRELRRRGREVLVAKYQLSPGNHLAMFAGGGMELADRLIKDGTGFGLDDHGHQGPPDLEGLSCRWEPYHSLHGRMLSLLVRTLEPDDLALQRQIVARLGEILHEGAEAARPVQPANMRFIWPPKGLAAEAILTQGRRPRALRRVYLMLESFLQAIAERFDLKIGPYDAPAYREELRRNSDHRKLADSLHMVLDCTGTEVAAIEAYLAGLHAAGRIVYGIHQASRAMMTCLVFSLEQGRHVHFIDGADGGFAFAALQLKAQLRALAAARTAAPAAQV